jgi:hypothetical protein
MSKNSVLLPHLLRPARNYTTDGLREPDEVYNIEHILFFGPFQPVSYAILSQWKPVDSGNVDDAQALLQAAEQKYNSVTNVETTIHVNM